MHETLLHILNNDPDGMPAQPSEWAREKFRAWVIENYGNSVWVLYNSTWAY